MSESESRLLSDRANRDAARSLVEGDFEQVKADLAARGVAGRIKDSVVEAADRQVHHAIEVAEDNKPIVAGTIAALLVWSMRNPIKRLFARVFGSDSEDHGDGNDA